MIHNIVLPATTLPQLRQHTWIEDNLCSGPSREERLNWFNRILELEFSKKRLGQFSDLPVIGIIKEKAPDTHEIGVLEDGIDDKLQYDSYDANDHTTLENMEGDVVQNMRRDDDSLDDFYPMEQNSTEQNRYNVIMGRAVHLDDDLIGSDDSLSYGTAED